MTEQEMLEEFGLLAGGCDCEHHKHDHDVEGIAKEED